MAQQKIQSSQLSATGVTPGSYTATDITVDAAGRITSATNGSGGAPAVPDTQVAFGSPSNLLTSDPSLTYDVGTETLTVGTTGTAIVRALAGQPLSLESNNGAHAVIIGSAGDLTINGSTGTSGQVLTSAGPGTAPSWSTPTAAVPNGYVLQLDSDVGGMPLNGVDYSTWVATELQTTPFAIYDAGGEVPGIKLLEAGTYLVTIQQSYTEYTSSTWPVGLTVVGVRTSIDVGGVSLSPVQTTNFVTSTATPGYDVNELAGYTAANTNNVRFTDTFTVTTDGTQPLFYPVAYGGNYLTPTTAMAIAWTVIIQKIGTVVLP